MEAKFLEYYIQRTVDNIEDAQLLDQLYQMKAGKRKYYINPTTGGTIRWRSVQSSNLGSEIAWDDWQQGGYEINTRRCANIWGFNWIGTELRGYPTISNMHAVNTFITKVEEKVPIEHRVPLMDVALQSMSARWWATHRDSLPLWEDVAKTLRTRFHEASGPQFI